MLQINMVKYNANWENTNTYENSQIIWSQLYTDKLILIYIQSNLNIFGLSVFRFVNSEYQQRAIWLHLTIQSAIRWSITKVILNYLPLPSWMSQNCLYPITIQIDYGYLLQCNILYLNQGTLLKVLALLPTFN
jgi:hypothetical protein